MTTETMTIHKALCEKKILDSRIRNAIDDEAVFVIANKKSNTKVSGIGIEDYKKQMQGTYDKITDLLNRRSAIKKAISNSNASTVITINGKQYTVAEAIEMKNTGVDLYYSLLSKMKYQWAQAQRTVSIENGDKLDKRLHDYLAATYGSSDSASKAADVKETSDKFIEAQSFVIVDPLNLYKKIEALEKFINEFNADVDSAISVSNALTTVTIEY